MDTRSTLKTFTWPSAILSIMVTAYPATERSETSPAEVTVGHAIYPKVRRSPQFGSNPTGLERWNGCGLFDRAVNPRNLLQPSCNQSLDRLPGAMLKMIPFRRLSLTAMSLRVV